MAQLTSQQQKLWSEVLDLLGVPPSACTGSVNIAGSEACFSSHAGRTSAAQPHAAKIASLEQMRTLAGGAPSKTVEIPEPWSGSEARDLNQKDEGKLRRALFAYAMGRGEEVASYREVLLKRFFPLPVTVYSGKDIEIKKGQTLTIEPDGHDPVVVNYGIVKLEEGGHIRCEAPVLFVVQKFIKTKGN